MKLSVLIIATKPLLLKSSSIDISNIFGSYSLELSNELHINEAIKFCDSTTNCAGVSEYYDDIDNNTSSYGSNATGNEHHHVIVHSFIPAKTQDSNLELSMKYKSSKPFIFHKGSIKRGTVLSMGHTDMTITEAKTYCNTHPKCVGFVYPIHSFRLTSPDNITFVSSISEFSLETKHEWYSFISNDVRKAKYINETSIKISDETIHEKPFSSCCHAKTDIPTMQDIMNVDTLPRISCEISKEEFKARYEMTRTPVMLVGCDKHWPAQKAWDSFPVLFERFQNNSEWRGHLGNSNEINDNAKWEEYIKGYYTKKGLKLFDQLDREHSKTLIGDYSIPAPLQSSDLYDNIGTFPGNGYGTLRWFCAASGNTGTDPHMDPIQTDAWNSLVRGHKWWILYPENIKSEKQVLCDEACTTVQDPLPIHWYASVGINALNTEYHSEQQAQHILQKPGETIYVPYGILHSVYNMDETIGVTANFGSIGNFNNVWGEIVSSGNEKHWKRAYYQTFDKAKRKLARQSSFWPPQDYLDFDFGTSESSDNSSDDVEEHEEESQDLDESDEDYDSNDSDDEEEFEEEIYRDKVKHW